MTPAAGVSSLLLPESYNMAFPGTGFWRSHLLHYHAPAAAFSLSGAPAH